MNFDFLKLSMLPLDAGTCPAEPLVPKVAPMSLTRKISRVALLVFVDGVVDVLQVPVVHDGHHDAQAVEFARAGERILFPLPGADLLLPAGLAGESGIGDMAAFDAVAPRWICRSMMSADAST